MVSRILPAGRRALRYVAGVGLAGFTCALIAMAIAAEKADVGKLTAPETIAVTAHPIRFSPKEPDRRDFGRLEFIGEVALTSTSEYFGGYSAIALDEKGERFLTLSDAGGWMSGRLVYEGGRVTGVADARVGAIPQKNGSPLGRGERDVESLSPLAPGDLDGRFLIGFERRHRIEEYAFEKGAMRGPVGRRPLPEQIKGMSSNSGLESLGILRGGPFSGALMLFPEEKLDSRGHYIGALAKDGKSHPLFMTHDDGFAITDMQGLPDGAMIVLERNFNPATRRLDIRLRRIPATEIKPGAVLSGEVLLDAGPGLEIDNFEGLALHRTGAGETILTIISDDNFNFFQRTLLAQFKLK